MPSIQSNQEPDRGPTVSRLREDIDSGRTGDKIPWPDPAAAPLGTDEEAAGTPVPASAVAQAHAFETSGPQSRGQGPDRVSFVDTGGYAGMLVTTFLAAVALWFYFV